MKYIFVGDIHGKLDVVKKALDMDGQIIFVGDLVDSFYSSTDDQIECVKIVLSAIDEGKARCIFGNHELSYLMPSHRCSGFSREMEAYMKHFEKEIMEKFDPYITFKKTDEYDPFIISHAGFCPEVYNDWVEQKDGGVWFLNQDSMAHWVSYARGGFKPFGGIFWLDIAEFQPVTGINQIFGHTSRGGNLIRKMHTPDSLNWCIDCLDKRTEFLELDIDTLPEPNILGDNYEVVEE